MSDSWLAECEMPPTNGFNWTPVMDASSYIPMPGPCFHYFTLNGNQTETHAVHFIAAGDDMQPVFFRGLPLISAAVGAPIDVPQVTVWS